MKRALYLLVFLLCFSSASHAAAYHNDKFGFSLNIPAEFQDMPSSAPFSIASYTNEKIFLQLRYINPQDTYSGPTFGTATKTEIAKFIKRQRFVAALNTAKFKFSTYDTHTTANGFTYVWAMFSSNIQIDKDNFRTYMLRNYFLKNNIIIELDFIIPEEELPTSKTMISDIIASFEFDKSNKL